MAFFDNMMGKISQATQNTAKKVKDFSETSRLNVEINNSEKQINELYKEIGAKVFTMYHDAPIPELADLFARVDGLNANIATIREQIQAITSEGTCPNCGAKVNKDVPFCSACGTKLQ